MTTRLALAATAVLVTLTAGCAQSTPSSVEPSRTGSSPATASGSTDDSASSADSTSGTSPAEADSTPATEGTGAESPLPTTESGPTISVASLPIGGDVEQDGARQCAHVNLITNEALPKGLSISIGSIDLDPEGVFTLGGDLCAPDSTPCTTAWTWNTDTPGKECTVAVTQVTDSAESVTLVLTGTVRCQDQSVCDRVRSEFDGGGAQIEFTAWTGVVTVDPPAGASSGPTATGGSGLDSSSPTVSPSEPGQSATPTETSTTGG